MLSLHQEFLMFITMGPPQTSHNYELKFFVLFCFAESSCIQLGAYKTSHPLKTT